MADSLKQVCPAYVPSPNGTHAQCFNESQSELGRTWLKLSCERTEIQYETKRD